MYERPHRNNAKWIGGHIDELETMRDCARWIQIVLGAARAADRHS